jgi:hypothetical protein
MNRLLVLFANAPQEAMFPEVPDCPWRLLYPAASIQANKPVATQPGASLRC